jgi:BirA family biotin operon repressor/biotin-[acetyl-CoA-carboxylase] ligase
MKPLLPRRNVVGGPLVHLDTTASTNEYARLVARNGAPDGTVVVAEEQTAGRGRQGRSWSAPRGRALTLSAVYRGAAEGFAGALELLPLAVALAVCDACEAVAEVRCEIKWPNDVWIERRKVAGVLIEARPAEGWAVIGIGLNVDTAEEELGEELRETATSLRIAAGRPADREAELDALLAALARRLDPDGEGGRERVLSAFRARDALAGARITWRVGDREGSGEARGIDERGGLVVFGDDGEHVVLDAGEVHLG